MNDQTNTPQPATGHGSGRAHQATHALGFALLLAGLVAWMWTGDWRYAISGLAGLLAAAVFAPATRREDDQP